MFQANLPKKFWGECVLTAAHLINRTPSKFLLGKIPYKIIYGQKPSYDHIRVFGALCFAQNKLRTKDKFASRRRKCLLVGYPLGHKGWRLYDLENHEFFVSQDVVFHEHIYPFVKAEEKLEHMS